MLDLPVVVPYGCGMKLNTLGVVVTLTKPTACENCSDLLSEGAVVKHLRGVGYQHLVCDALASTKRRHPTNRKQN